MDAAPKTGEAKPTTGIAGNAPPAKMKRKVSAEEDEHKRNSRLGKELIAYCIFLILFCVVTVVPIDDPNYEGLSYAMRDLMLETDHTSFNTNASFAGPKFAAVSSVSDYWKWLRGPFLHAIYMSDWYAGSPWSVGDQGLVAGNNLIVGTVRRERERERARERTLPCTLPPFLCIECLRTMPTPEKHVRIEIMHHSLVLEPGKPPSSFPHTLPVPLLLLPPPAYHHKERQEAHPAVWSDMVVG